MNVIRRLLLTIALLSPLGAQAEMDHGLAHLSSIFTDKYQFAAFGTEDVCPQLGQEARAVFRDLGLTNGEDIHVKRMTNELLELYKKEGDRTAAFATHNALFIDEDYFMSLTAEKRRFYLGHEATHIKNKDSVRFAVALALGAAVIPTSLATMYNHSVPAGLAMGGLVWPGALVAILAFRRHIEAQADAGGERVAPRIQYFQHDHKDLPLVDRVKMWLASWLDTYHGQTY